MPTAKSKSGENTSPGVCLGTSSLNKLSLLTSLPHLVWQRCVIAVLIKIMSCLDKTFDF